MVAPSSRKARPCPPCRAPHRQLGALALDELRSLPDPLLGETGRRRRTDGWMQPLKRRAGRAGRSPRPRPRPPNFSPRRSPGSACPRRTRPIVTSGAPPGPTERTRGRPLGPGPPPEAPRAPPGSTHPSVLLREEIRAVVRAFLLAAGRGDAEGGRA